MAPRSRGRFLPVLALVALLALAVTAARGAPKRDVSLLRESQAGARRALLHLKSTQGEDGSWSDHPAITALVVMAMVGSGQDDFGPASDPVRSGLDFIRSHAKPEGGIYDQFYPSYSTSVCAQALFAAGTPEDEALVRNARRFLLDSQADESEGFTPDSLEYGGWGYEISPSREETHRADLSNTQLALEALRQLEALDEQDRARSAAPDWAQTPTEVAYGRAIKFLERCQNLDETNNQDWASDDGGFVYRPGESKAGESPDGGLRSYAGMTYAGLKSMLYARLDRDDPRVRAAHGGLVGAGRVGRHFGHLLVSQAGYSQWLLMYDTVS